MWSAGTQKSPPVCGIPLVRCRLGLCDVRRHAAKNPQSLCRKILPSFRCPHESPLLTFFTLEAEPSILIAHRHMCAGPEWIHAAIGLQAAISHSIRGGGARIFRPALVFPPLFRRGSDEPNVPPVPIRINKISKAHFTAWPAVRHRNLLARQLPNQPIEATNLQKKSRLRVSDTISVFTPIWETNAPLSNNTKKKSGYRPPSFRKRNSAIALSAFTEFAWRMK
jgi:hypothetical protein